MKHTIKHDLNPDMARRATQSAFENYAARFDQYNPKADWVTESHAKVSFSAKGITLRGDFVLRPGEIEIQLDVPFILKPFSKRAVTIVEEEVQEWVEKARRGDV